MNMTERKPSTPGEILKEEFMQPYGLTQQQLAEKIGVTRRRINEIIKEKRGITSDTACRLARLFGMSAEYWLNLQMKLDLWKEMHDKRKKRELLRITPILPLVPQE